MQGHRVTQSSCLMLQFAKMEAQSCSMRARGQLRFSCPSWHRHRIMDSELLSPVTFPLSVSSIGLVSFNSRSRLFLLVAMPHTTSTRTKAYSTTSTPCLLCPLSKSQLLHRSTSHLSLLTVNADDMAAQMSKYMDTFEEHASIARKDPDFSNAYQHCLDEGQALPPNTKWPLLNEQGIKIVQSRMEAILERQAKAIDE